jgi:hypothetical protein
MSIFFGAIPPPIPPPIASPGTDDDHEGVDDAASRSVTTIGVSMVVAIVNADIDESTRA